MVRGKAVEVLDDENAGAEQRVMARLGRAASLVGRTEVKADEAEYLKKFKLTPEQTQAVLKRDYNRLLELGGNIYFTAKLGATDGHSFQHMAAVMTGSTQEDYAKMMLAGGRSVEGNRSKSKPAGRTKPAARKASAKPASTRPASKRPASIRPVSKRRTRSGSKRG